MKDDREKQFTDHEVFSDNYVPVGDDNLKYLAGKDFKSQLKNNLYYYRIHIAAIALVVILIGVMVSQCVNRIKPDVSILICFSTPLSQAQSDIIQQEFSHHVADYNGDGKIFIQIVNTSFSASGDPQMVEAMQSKRIAELTTNDCSIVITDDQSFSQIVTNTDVNGATSTSYDAFSKEEFFTAQSGYAWNWSGSQFFNKTNQGILPQNTYFSIRAYNAKNAKQVKAHDQAVIIMKKLIAANPPDGSIPPVSSSS